MPMGIPKSYETLPVIDFKVLHHPEGAPVATPVVVVTLNRPDKNNVFSTSLMDTFEKLYPLFDVDERRQNHRIDRDWEDLCAGADLKATEVEREVGKVGQRYMLETIFHIP
ncbi:hypothetical protein BDV26DRAFT_289639 [Aspergillus bertholletiae]|uniref:Uncharacterized protein n=1 Tax=Aspergillus bertholletiae TaxID=1226010 RepID=A0A5N7BH80_9EURO|nr:hypothetical protein BDV26DRAFT_289639 [Aspergillus bertholletiae]